MSEAGGAPNLSLIGRQEDVDRWKRFGIDRAAELLNNHAAKLKDAGQFVTAEINVRRALAMCPESPLLHNSLGSILWNQGRYDEAAVHIRWSLVLEPNNSGALSNLGMTLASMRSFDGAHEAFDRAIELEPDNVAIKWDRAMMLLDSGAWDEGFREYEHRRAHRGERLYPKMPFPYWTGVEDLNGKTLFVQAEQGAGDRILMSRYLAWVKATWDVRILCLMSDNDMPSLTALMWHFQSDGIVDQFLPTGIPWPRADYGVFLGSLPGICWARTGDVVGDPGLILKRAAGLAGEVVLPEPHVRALKVGVCWTGNPMMIRNQERSMPLELLLELETIPNVQLYSLQFRPGANDIQRLGAHETICDTARDIETSGKGIVGTAQVILNLDLVVTVCTSIAHLAGALGVPTWTMLCRNAYWIWGLDGERTPWYPSMRLFRQRAQGAWRPVVDRVKSALAEHATHTLLTKERLHG